MSIGSEMAYPPSRRGLPGLPAAVLILLCARTLQAADDGGQAPWWNASWERRLILEPDLKDGDPARHVARIDIETPAEFQPDGRDLRAVDSAGALLPIKVHFIERGGQSRLDVLLSAQSQRFIVYYGNPQALELFTRWDDRLSVPAHVVGRERRNRSLHVDFDFTQDEVAVAFRNRSQDPASRITSYRWTFGDGETSELHDPRHTFPRPGRYSVTLRCTNEAGDEDAQSRTVAARCWPDIETLKAGEPTALTRDPSWEGEPSFSPDGSRIVFTSDRSGSSEIYTMGSDGAGVTEVTQWDTSPDLPSNRGYPYRCQSPAWSPDGRWIAFSANRHSPTEDLWVVPAQGGRPVRFTPDRVTTNERSPAWSPDGLWIAFTSDEGDLPNIWVKPTGGGPARRLTTHRAAEFPTWHPSGTRVGFLSDRGTSPTYACLWQAHFPSGSETSVTQKDTGKPGPFSWSPDGEYVTYARTVGGGYGDLQSNAVFLLDTRTGKSRQLTALEEHCDSPTWSPDGSTIVFRRMERRTGNSDIWAIALAPRRTLPARPASPDPAVPVETDPERLYREAGDLLCHHRRYQDAIDRFVTMARQHPDHALAPEALSQAGLAATVGALDYPLGAAICGELTARYPHHLRAPDAMFLEGLCLERMKRLEKLTVLRLNDRQSGRRCVPKRYFLQCVDVLKRLGYGVDGCDDPAAALSTTPPSGRGLELSLDYDFFYPSDREVSVHVRADVPEESRTRDALDVKLVSRDGAVTRSIRVEPPVSLDSVVPFPLAGLEPGRWDTRGYRVEAVLGEARASRDFGLLPTPRPPQAAPAPRIEQGCLATESPQILIGTDDWRAAARIGCNASLAMPTGSALDQIRDAGLWAIATAPPFNPDDWSMFTEPAAARSGVSPRLDAYRAAAADCSDHPALLGWLVIDEPEGRYSFSAFETVEDGARFFADADDVLSKARPPRPAGVALSGNWLDRFDLFGPLSGFVFVPRDQLPRRKGPFQGLVCAGIRRQPPIPFLEAFGRTSGARHERWAAWWSLLHGARGVWFEAADPSLRQLTAELRFFAPALPAIEPVEIKPPNACLAARLSRSGVQYVVVCRRDELPAHLTVELVLPGNRTAAKVLGTEREILIDSGSLKLELAPFSVMILEVGTRP